MSRGSRIYRGSRRAAVFHYFEAAVDGFINKIVLIAISSSKRQVRLMALLAAALGMIFEDLAYAQRNRSR